VNVKYKTLEEKLAELDPDERAEIEKRAAELIAEEMSLQELRRARKLTQVRMAKKLKVGQESISRLEKRTDLHISTLRHYVEAMGGSLSLVARFPDREPIELTGIHDMEKKPAGSIKARTTSRTRPRRPKRDDAA
jgi:transcriptional regulator with XRE-family HTH domain